jgi:hypothetical protein
MYSLVSAPVLGFDLTRLPGGPATAEVLLRALCLVRDDLPVLAQRLPDEDSRAALWLEVEDASRRRASLRSVATGDDPAQVLAVLERAPIGSLDALLRLVRHDVMAWTWTGTGTGNARGQDDTAARATALLCDAVVACYLSDQLSETTRRRLGAGWVAAQRRLTATPPIDLGPHHYVISALLQRLGALRPEDVRRLDRSAQDERRHPGAWSTAVHSATWAAYLAGRVSTAAAAQLLLVQALDLGAIPLVTRATGTWNLASGAVQALVVRDLLDTSTAHRLLAPVIAALGPSWLD